MKNSWATAEVGARTATGNPAWVNEKEYPFAPHYFKVRAGAMHYVDEGRGDPIVFLHGNPSWSFLYRGLIKALRNEYRCIAPDYIGYGLSDKPHDIPVTPRDNAGYVEELLESLDLQNITLVVGDWGGPTGFHYATRHPDRIKAIVINNTWCWPVDRDLHYILFSGLMGGPIGRFMIRKYNIFADGLLKMNYAVKSRLTPEIRRHYVEPFRKSLDRKVSWESPKYIVQSSAWYQEMFDKMSLLAHKKILIAWAMKDPAFGKKMLAVWMQLFPNADVLRLEDAGHFVAEEKADDIAQRIREVLSRA